MDGEWEPPMIDNPEYKGEWKPRYGFPVFLFFTCRSNDQYTYAHMLSTFHHKDFLSCRQIDNPDYKGPWVHPEIDNPEYNPDDAKDIGKYAENCKIGFDLWQVRSQAMFCNKLLPTCQPPLSYN